MNFFLALILTSISSFGASTPAPTPTPVPTPTQGIDFTLSRATTAVNVPVNFAFVPSSDPSAIVSYQWDLGDGTQVQAMAQFTHQYQDPGTYTVTLNTVDAVGIQGVATKQIQILADDYPSADFYFYGGEIDVGDDVDFISQAKPGGEEILSYAWSINTTPTTAGLGKSFRHNFSQPGTYTVSHVVTDLLGAQTTVSKQLTVQTPDTAPILTVSFPEEASLRDGIQVPFQASAGTDQIVAASWQLDGYPEVSFAPGQGFANVIFPREGVYRLSIRVYDRRGTKTESSNIIRVMDLGKIPRVKLFSSSGKVPVGNVASFWAKFRGNNTQYFKTNFDFGDGTSVTSLRPYAEHVYTSPGTYTVTATLSFNNQVQAVASVAQTVVGSNAVRTTPTQVVANSRNYVETIKTVQLSTTFSAYLNGSEIYGYGTPTCSSSNSSVMSVSCTTGGVTITGNGVGQATYTVSAGGVSSQPITVNVLDVVGNNAVVTHDGSYVASSQDEFCYYMNRTVGVYFITEQFSPPAIGSFSYPSPYYSDCFQNYIPYGLSTITFSSQSSPAADFIVVNKPIPNVFEGRNGYLSLDASQIQINYLDSRFVNWNQDFSISFWTLNDNSGNKVYPTIDGNFQLQPNGTGGNLVVNGTSGSAYLNVPTGYDFYDRWEFVAYVFTYSSNSLALYVDGQLIGSVTVPSGSFGHSGSLRIGEDGAVNESGTAVDELRFWGKAMSATELTNEMFSPAALSSPTLLAAFSFDTGNNGIQTSDNGSGWTYQFLNQGTAGAPNFTFPPTQISQQIISASASSEIFISGTIPYGDFSNSQVSLLVAPGTFSMDQLVYIQVSPCLGECSQLGEPSDLDNEQVSPYVYVSYMPNQTNNGLLLKIPFDVQSVAPSDLKNIKVISRGSEGYLVDNVLVPTEVNALEGYVSVEITWGGIYWVGIPTDYSTSVPNFTNPELNPLFGGLFGARGYDVTISSSQSSYTLNSTVAFPNPTYVTCYSASSANSSTYSAGGNSLTISSLQTGNNQCSLYYNFLGSSDYSASDLFTISRSGP